MTLGKTLANAIPALLAAALLAGPSAASPQQAVAPPAPLALLVEVSLSADGAPTLNVVQGQALCWAEPSVEPDGGSGIEVSCGATGLTGRDCIAVVAEASVSNGWASVTSACQGLSAGCDVAAGLFGSAFCHDEDSGRAPDPWRCRIAGSAGPLSGSCGVTYG